MTETDCNNLAIRQLDLVTLDEHEALAEGFGWDGKIVRMGPDVRAGIYRECTFSQSKYAVMEDYSAPVSLQSGLDSRQIALGMYLSTVPAKANGMATDNARVYLCLPGSDYEVLTPEAGSLLSIRLPRGDLESRLGVSCSTLENVLTGHRFRPVQIDSESSLLMRWCQRWTSGYQPGNEPERRSFCELFDAAISEILLDVLASNETEPKNGRIDKTCRVKINRLIDYFHANPDQVVKVDDMIRITGFRRRSLFYLFKEFTGYTPVQYFSLLRLGMAHRELKAGRLDVTQAALDYNFNHLGEFSALYKRIYGELPSETRKRRLSVSVTSAA